MKTTMCFLLVLLLIAAIGCSGSNKPPETITLATTTSTRDSGLLDELVPMFKHQTGIEIKVVAVGSGQALEIGRRGDADVLLTHAPAAEEEFLAEGYASDRRPVMHNDFVLVGPPSDPGKLKGKSNIAETFTHIAEGQTTFVSRGDESGTHMKEKAIWDRAAVTPGGDWYVQAGAGMAQTIRIASEKRAYTLTDRGTYLAQSSGLDLAVICEDDPLLQNHYSVMLVNPAKHPRVHSDAARKFADFLVSPKTQQRIAIFGVDKYGQPLFFPHSSEPVTPQ